MIQAAAIYARISDDRDGDALGVQRQLRDCRELATSRGWPVVAEYVDNDVSAYRGRRRPAYRRLVADIAAGEIDALLVWHLDRLHRQPLELEEFFTIIDALGTFELASVSGRHDLSTGDGQFYARIMGAVARKESDDKSRRIRRKHQELAEAGALSGGGMRPFGFELDRITVREDEAAIVRELARRFLAGEALYSLRLWLRDSGIPTTTGKDWSTQTLRRMLHSARISGRRENHGQIVATAQWPAIISPTESDRIRALLDDPHRRDRRPARRYLLAGVLRCHRCGATLIARPRQDGVRRYTCPTGRLTQSCGGTQVLAEPVEQLIADAVVYRLSTPEMQRALTSAPTRGTARIERDIAEAHAQLEELAEMYGRREVSAPEWLSARRPIEARLRDARRDLEERDQTAALAYDARHGSQLASAWPTLQLSRQRAIIATILDHAIIGPAHRGWNRFDPSRIEPVWRH